MGYRHEDAMRRCILSTLVFCGMLNAGSGVIHKFSLWGAYPKDAKLSLYTGWTNGFFSGKNMNTELASCVDDISDEQAIAMIDKFYADHPEKWSNLLSDEIVEALTVKGGPCYGKR